MKMLVNPMPELTPQLKRLSLSGIVETFAERNREAIENKLTYTEFFALLIQDEIMRREQNKFDKRIKTAGLIGNKTLESFDFNFNPKINEAQIKELATCNYIQERVPVLIVGPCGTGKTHLIQALGHCAVKKGIDVILLTQTELLNELQAAKATGSYEKKLRTFIKVPLFIIDDFGLKPLVSPQDESLYDLIAARYEKAATIVTSNLDFNEWGAAFPNKLLGASAIDRLRHGAYKIILEGKSYRSPKETKKFKSEK
jgi:DNA replication protein DnaC